MTDHNDLDFPEVPDDACFDLDIEQCISTLSALRDELFSGRSPLLKEGEAFDLRIGVEQGVMESTCDILNDYSKLHPGLDFIICSTHVVDNMDPYYPDFWDDRNPEECYMRYFENTLYNAEHFTDYNVYGHLDYILRYGPCPKQQALVNIDSYMEIIEAILKAVIEGGKGIEINTGSLYRGLDYCHPNISILKLYKELGGEILTFGSDAHDSTHVGYKINEAAGLAKSVGFRYYCTFSKMKPEFINL